MPRKAPSRPEMPPEDVNSSAGSSGVPALYFPVTGNPLGFNHFALAEWLLRRNPALGRVVWIISNGHHPDPTKADAGLDGSSRLGLAELALGALADPAASYLAARAGQHGEKLALSAAVLELSPVEFGFARAVRTAELLPFFFQAAPPDRNTADGSTTGGKSTRLDWVAGSDLIRRMCDERIFSADDLRALAGRCRYHVPERKGDPVAEALNELSRARGISLEALAYPLEEAPDWLAPFLDISSTAIRRACEAGDPLGGMLPRPAAERIIRENWYAAGRPAARVVDQEGRELATRTGWELACAGLEAEVRALAVELAGLLLQRRGEGRPHRLALAETSTGGELCAALTGRSGASGFFSRGLVPYDASARAALTGQPPGGEAVSEQAALELARGLLAQGGADYALAETGMAGPPDGLRRSIKNGRCWLAWCGPEGHRTRRVDLNPFLTRREHRLVFSREALALALEGLKGR